MLILLFLVLAYTWVGFPALVLWLGRRATVPVAIAGESELPYVAVVFSAFNEEAVIEQRLANFAAVDYDEARMHVWVGVDGGTDQTATLAQNWAASHANVTAVVAERNSGKMAMLKRLVANARAREPRLALLVFTDANTMFEPDAMRQLVTPFTDPSVGGVCGRLVLEHGAAGKTDERTYWDTESRLKEAESRLDSCLGANGAIYAIRAELFPDAIPDNTIVDDFVIGMRVREQGYRMLFEAAAVAREDLPPNVADEWRRRVRIGAGVYQALVMCRRLLSPSFGVFAWLFWSHKVLRWFTPHLLLLAFALTAVAVGHWWWEAETAAKGISVAAALLLSLTWFATAKSNASGLPHRLTRMAGYFLAMQTALFMGFIRFCRGNLKGTWARTSR